MNPQTSSRRGAEPRRTHVALVSELPPPLGLHRAMQFQRKGAKAQRRRKEAGAPFCSLPSPSGGWKAKSPTGFAPLRLCVFALKSWLLLFGVWLVCHSASAQFQLLPDAEPQRVFASESRVISARFHNPGATTAEADIRIQLHQATSATTALLGEVPWKHLQVLPGQTVLETARLTFPDVKAETLFLVRWLAGDSGTGFQPVPADRGKLVGAGQTGRLPVPLLGVTSVLAYPTNLLAELQSLAEDEALGVFDPRGLLKPLLRRCAVLFTDLEETGVADFRGRLAILGPFLAKADAPADLRQRVEAMARKGVAAVWFQPPPGPRYKLQPSFSTVSFGTNGVVIAAASLAANLAESPRAQLNLLQLCRGALHPEPPRLPTTDDHP